MSIDTTPTVGVIDARRCRSSMNFTLFAQR
jgi:hypothetical protein